MRRCTFFCFVLLLVAFIAFPLTAGAQFHDPTKEELSMTSDPKAPGAAAVYLYFEQKTDDDLHYRSVYARIKVLTEKGKDLATVEVPYTHGEQKVTDIKARTIHADGTVVPLEGKPGSKPEDLLAMKVLTRDGVSQIAKRVINLPSVEVGSILEYQYTIRYDDNVFSSPWWDIQKAHFVHQAHYMFMPFKAFQKGSNAITSRYLIDWRGRPLNTLMWWPLLPAGANISQDATGRFSLDLSDIPPAPHEAFMPPMDAFLYQLYFYYMSATNAEDFWNSEAKLWSKDVDHFAEPTGAIKTAVAGIVAPGDSDLDKAHKLYKAVQALDNTDYSRARGKAELKAMGLKPAKRAEDTWAQKSGSSQDITLLYLAMLRAAGLTAYDIKVVNRARNLFQPRYLRFEQLDDDLVILSTGGKEYLLDPGEKMCPFLTVSWTHELAGGVRQSADGRAATVTPALPYMKNTMTRIGDVTIDANGAMTGSIRFLMTGQEALRWRQMMLETDEEEVKKRFDQMLPGEMPEGTQAHLDHFLGMDDPEVNLMAIVKVEGTLGMQAGKRLLLPGFFFESRTRQPFVDEDKRQAPVDMHYASTITDQVTYHLPAGYTVEGAPKDSNIPWSPKAQLVTKITQDEGKIVVVRQLTRGFAVLKADQYQDLRGFYEKVAANDQQQVVLAKAAVAQK
jgi:Domain of Unknown Function with PDB structure (DUF3857)/Transglutaminase-like superfamily